MKDPLIFDIQRCSSVDGPGIRTTVFLKGCNLDCFWCHNPEGKKSTPELAFFDARCIGCGLCKRICSSEKCILCGKCAESCVNGARKYYGKSYADDELLDILLEDKMFYDATDGGVTFSGGECMLYPEYLERLLKRLKEKGVHTAVDTAGNIPFESFERVLPYADLFLYDIKCIDENLHKKGTGVSNRLILENLDKLIERGADIIIRVPVIPDFNDSSELDRIKEYVCSRGLTAEYLPYHEMGLGKKEALDKGKKI